MPVFYLRIFVDITAYSTIDTIPKRFQLYPTRTTMEPHYFNVDVTKFNKYVTFELTPNLIILILTRKDQLYDKLSNLKQIKSCLSNLSLSTRG